MFRRKPKHSVQVIQVLGQVCMSGKHISSFFLPGLTKKPISYSMNPGRVNIFRASGSCRQHVLWLDTIPIGCHNAKYVSTLWRARVFGPSVLAMVRSQMDPSRMCHTRCAVDSPTCGADPSPFQLICTISVSMPCVRLRCLDV